MKKLVSPATTRTIEVPAEYRTATKRVLKNGGWIYRVREIDNLNLMLQQN